jgi:hypothetical protein
LFIQKRGQLINKSTFENFADVEIVKFSDFDMGSPGWLKHDAEMFHAQPKNIFSNGVS